MIDNTFNGYRRPDGRIGIRNRVVVLSVMDTANPTVRRIADAVRGTTAITISFGRGQAGFDYDMTVRALVGLGSNPNVYAVLVVSLEPASAERVAEAIASTGKPVEVVTLMGDGGAIRATAKGVRWLADRAYEASRLESVRCSLADLVVGVECGGSDTTSGLASNPAVGEAADRVVDAGGTVVLSETSEWMGGEHLLAQRAVNADIGRRIIEAVQRVEQDAIRRGIDIRGQQPTADNIAGGLTTIEEKTLGAIRKGGTRPVAGFLEFAEQARAKGLLVMDTAAPAAESMTTLAAGGCQLILFSTGQGNPLGDPIAPTVKITGHPGTVEWMAEHIDVDVSDVTRGAIGIDGAGACVLAALVAVADGGLTRAEVLNEEVTTITRFERSL